MSFWSTIQDAWKVLWQGRGLDVSELARRVGVSPSELTTVNKRYWWHRIPKRSGGTRLLHSPSPELKRIQRLLLRRVFAKLKVHPAAKGFRRGESTVTHARLHVGKVVIVRMDICDFFHWTKVERLNAYFRKIGWNRRAARVLCELTTHKGLPQGAPTSPVLSNLVNYKMDARLSGLAARSGAVYSRYADDIIFSFDRDDRRFIRGVVRRVRRILFANGYRMHGRPKLKWMRHNQPQTITGLVVNEKVQLPRHLRRWLRSVEHHLKTGWPATLTRSQLDGWKAYERMVATQSRIG